MTEIRKPPRKTKKEKIMAGRCYTYKAPKNVVLILCQLTPFAIKKVSGEFQEFCICTLICFLSVIKESCMRLVPTNRSVTAEYLLCAGIHAY